MNSYAFALIDPGTFRLSQMNDYDTKLYLKFTGLKLTNPALKVCSSTGSSEQKGLNYHRHSSVLEDGLQGARFFQTWCRHLQIARRSLTRLFSSARRMASMGLISIGNVSPPTLKLPVRQCPEPYTFIDPVTADRQGSPADFANFVTFMQELKTAFGNLGVTATLPSSYWYLKGFDIKSLEPYVDWFNMMTYDIHGELRAIAESGYQYSANESVGTWDGNNP